MDASGGQQPFAWLGGDVVTGEAVVLELREAKLPSRALARIIDVVLQYALLFAAFVALGAISSGTQLDDAASAGIALLTVVAVIVGYPVLFETLSRGRTVGKLALGLQVVRDDGGPIRFRQALVRGLMGIFELWLMFVVAVLVSALSTRGKRIGDYLAGTVVVRVRMPRQAAPMVAMPPELAAWAATLDLSRLPDELALTARQFMARSAALRPDVRQPMGLRLAQDLSRYVSPAPATAVPPEVYLAAVLAERRRRDAARYQPAVPPPPPFVGYPAPAAPYAPSPPPPAPDAGPAPTSEPGFTLPF